MNKAFLFILLCAIACGAQAAKLSAKWPSKYLQDCKGIAYAYSTPNGTFFAVDDMQSCSRVKIEGEIHRMKKKKNGRFRFETEVEGVKHITLFSNRTHIEDEIVLARNLYVQVNGYEVTEPEVTVPSQQELALAYSARIKICGEHFNSRSSREKCVQLINNYPHSEKGALKTCSDFTLSTQGRFACLEQLKPFTYEPFAIVKACQDAYMSTSTRKQCIESAKAFDHSPEQLLGRCKNQFMSTRDQLNCFQLKFGR
ncbi:hypothetical protein [uncultured Microbulbifer sp.]|uniref:hypothetical protein n=1 Tax=uncultured Microbulbifer sp. TaxID=348147 RepID=UPI00262F28A8|nr:hypothetical protein [uncultured Microbulbifer sp.]